MKQSKYSVAFVLDSWFPEISGKQIHIRSIRTKLHQYYRVKTEIFYQSKSIFWFKILWPFWIASQIIKIHKTKTFSLIHSHGVTSGIAAKIASIIIKVPVIHTVHGSPNLDQKTKNINYFLEKFALTKIKYDQQISVSENFLKHKNVNKPVVIPNGVDVSAFDKIRTRKNKNPMLIWVGKNLPEKGVSVLKDAIVRVRKKIPKLETELVTGGSLTGEKLIRAYKRSHVFVLPSLAEGQPISLLEAWAAKLPVITTNVGDNAKLVQGGINGILIEPDNTNQLTKAILKILRSRSKGKPLGFAGYKLVKRKFSWGYVAQETFQVYKNALGRS